MAQVRGIKDKNEGLELLLFMGLLFVISLAGCAVPSTSVPEEVVPPAAALQEPVEPVAAPQEEVAPAAVPLEAIGETQFVQVSCEVLKEDRPDACKCGTALTTGTIDVQDTEAILQTSTNTVIFTKQDTGEFTQTSVSSEGESILHTLALNENGFTLLTEWQDDVCIYMNTFSFTEAE